MKQIILDTLNHLLSKRRVPKDIKKELLLLKQLVESSKDEDLIVTPKGLKKIDKWEIGKRIADISIILYKLFKDT